MTKSRAIWINNPALSVILLLFAFPSPSSGLTLNDAISMAKKAVPALRASNFQVESSQELYRSTLSPYVPSLDATYSHDRDLEAPRPRETERYDITVSYLLYDWGRRSADRHTGRINLETDMEFLKSALLDLELDVKTSYYTLLARKEILIHREIQLENAQKNLEITRGRFEIGVARRSEVLQASVRLEEARFQLTQAVAEVRKAVSELNSLIGLPLEQETVIEGTLDLRAVLPALELLNETALIRPEVRRAEYSVEVARQAGRRVTSEFLPTFSAAASYTKQNSAASSSLSREDKGIGIRAVWNIFELGKVHRKRSTEFETRVNEENLNELKRLVLLEVYRVRQDLKQALDGIEVAKEQLTQAEDNYAQAFEEYKVGRGDILSLVQAETVLADARIQLTVSRLNSVLAKSSLERVVGTQSLDVWMESSSAADGLTDEGGRN